MLLIGERINATREPVAKAFQQRDEAFFIKEARAQTQAGCDFIDLNCGTGTNEKELMAWLTTLLSKQNPTPFFFDSADAKVIEAGLSKVDEPQKHVCNSTPLDANRLSALLPIVREFGCKVVGLLMDERGIPKTAERRVEIAKKLLERFDAEGITPDRVFIDPIIEPIGVDASRALLVIQCIQKLKPLIAPAQIVVSVSGVSFGLPKRKVLNRTFLPMLAAAGADALIADPLDKDLIATLTATDALTNCDPYCLKYIQAYRSGKL